MTEFILQNTLLNMIPLLIVALAGMFAERSGVINLALEGEMIIGAFCGAVAVYSFQKSGAMVNSPQLMYIVAMIIAAACSAVYSLLLSFSAINLKADQTIGGTALNMLAPAIVSTIGLAFFNQEKIEMLKSTKYVIINDELTGLAKILGDRMYISTYIVIAIFILLSIWVYKSKTGMRMRACGEHPQAADSVGINVYKMRYAGVIISGALGGLGGLIYIAAANSTWHFDVGVAGAGFLALAVMIFGQWKPIRISIISLVFSFFLALSYVYSGIFEALLGFSLTAEHGVTSELFKMLPFIASLILLTFTSKRSRAPKAEGIPYDKSVR